MVASTIAAERETTQVRRRVDRDAINGEPVPLTGIVALDRLGLILVDVVPANGKSRIVGRIVVATEQPHAPALQPAQQAIERGAVAGATFPVDQPPRVAREGLPDPELARLFSRKCHISSISTTAVHSAGTGLGQCASACRRSQRITLCAETPTCLPIAFIDRPVQYSATAARFTAAGLPRGVVRVNCRPQPLHRQRCRPQA